MDNIIYAEAEYTPKPEFTENQKAFIGLLFILGLVLGYIWLKGYFGF